MPNLTRNCIRFIVGILLVFPFGSVTTSALPVEISGELLVGFGRASLESTTPPTDVLDGIGEATLNFSVSEGPVSGQIEITLVETAEELDTAEHELVWAISDSVSLTVSGFSFGIEPTDGNISVVMAPGGPVGDEEAFIDFADTGMLNLEVNLGGLVLGLALLDTCVPKCGFAVDSTADDSIIFPEVERSAVVTHLRGKAGDLKYNAYFAESSGSFSVASQLVNSRGSGFGIGLCFNLGCWELNEGEEEGGFFGFGLDFSSATTECQASAGDTPCTDDNEVTQSGVAVRLGQFAAHYYLSEDETGTETEEVTNIDLVFKFAAGPAEIGPEYRFTTTEPNGGVETTDTFLLFGMILEF